MALHIDLKATDDPRDAVHRAVQALAEGHLVVFPTETVYGVAASALNEQAVEKLADLTSGDLEPRDHDSLLSLAIKSDEDALDYAPDLPPLATRLARRCWPGPLTLVVDANHSLSAVRQLPATVRQIISPDKQVGLRVPGHEFLLSVLRLIAGPLAFTGANLPNQSVANTGAEALANLGDRVSMVIDDGPCKFAQSSTIVQVDDAGLRVLRPGVINESQLQKLASLMIVFVCTGNTCRSPMAAALMRKRLAESLGCTVDALEEKGVMVLSAGIAAMNGAGASPEAVTTMSAHQIDLSDHESELLTDRVARFADVILTMTRGHREAICAQWPEMAPRVHLLCHDHRDVSDPIGGPESLYQQCAAQIDAQLPQWLQYLESHKLLP